jgi:hypothetical protein
MHHVLMRAEENQSFFFRISFGFLVKNKRLSSQQLGWIYANRVTVECTRASRGAI